MRLEQFFRGILAIALTAGSSATVLAQDAGEHDPAAAARAFGKPAYSPYVGRNYPTRPYFGDTHLHTGVLDGRGRVRGPAHPAGRLPASPTARRSPPRAASR